jgi:hypothetical protein
MLIYVKTIDFPIETGQSVEEKRNLVNDIEQCGFTCKFVSGGIEVYAEKEESPWEAFKAMIKPEDI